MSEKNYQRMWHEKERLMLHANHEWCAVFLQQVLCWDKETLKFTIEMNETLYVQSFNVVKMKCSDMGWDFLTKETNSVPI